MDRKEFLHKEREGNSESYDKHTNRNSHWIGMWVLFCFYETGQPNKWNTSQIEKQKKTNKYTKIALRKGNNVFKSNWKLIKENPLESQLKWTF